MPEPPLNVVGDSGVHVRLVELVVRLKDPEPAKVPTAVTVIVDGPATFA